MGRGASNNQTNPPLPSVKSSVPTLGGILREANSGEALVDWGIGERNVAKLSLSGVNFKVRSGDWVSAIGGEKCWWEGKPCQAAPDRTRLEPVGSPEWVPWEVSNGGAQ